MLIIIDIGTVPYHIMSMTSTLMLWHDINWTQILIF